MRYLVLATDYDGTLAHDGQVDDHTLAALAECRESGRKLVMVTGRELDDLMRVYSRFDLFDWIVAENGGLLYQPSTRRQRPLASPPSEVFVEALRQRGVPISVGRGIVATWEPHEEVVLRTIRELGLELQVIFNKGAVMVLPTGVNKASGLTAALAEMGISSHSVVGVGDAENDHAFLRMCEAGVVVSNSVPSLAQQADLVTQGARGAGVAELIGKLVANDLVELEPRLTRHHLLLGHREDGSEYRLRPYGRNVLVCGTSGGGKSTLATALLERLEQAQYQFCIIDPEGDYAEFEPVVALGTAQQIPQVDAAVRLVQDGRHNAAVNLIGMPLDDRPAQFAALLGRLQELRAGTGRPHWILVDEAHHVLPSSYETNNFTFPAKLRGMVFVTLQPDLLPHAALRMVDTVIAAGGEPRESLQTFAEAVKIDLPPGPSLSLESGEYLVWEVDSGRPPTRVRLLPGQSLRRRHSRKYAEGELEPDRSFYFRGPDGKLSLRAQNLMLFLQLADGVDDETWLYHLGRGDYSQWFREGIKDESLAAEVAEVEGHQRPSPEESRRRIRELVEQRYTLPVPAPKSIVTEEAPTQ